MATGKYAPRDYAPDPNNFGKDRGRIAWPEPPEDRVERARSRAAHVQAAVAERVHMHLMGGVVTRADLRERTGWTRERLSRILNGNIVAGLDDLMLLLNAVHVPFESVISAATAEQQSRQRHLREVQRYLSEQQQRVQEEIARIERERRGI